MNTNNVKFDYSIGNSQQLYPSEKPEVVFSGRSNVGKSSLINRLVNRKTLARVSATPGKTATINFFTVDRFHLVDLPGYGYAKVSQANKQRWADLVEGYFAQGRNISLVVQIIDLRHEPSADDMNMIDFLYNSGLPFIIVMTKKDKLNKTQLAKRLEDLKHELKGYEDIPQLAFSALSGEGTEDIRNIIDKYIDESM